MPTIQKVLQNAPAEARRALEELLREMPAPLRARCTRRTLPKGETLVHMQSPCTSVYLLAEGSLQAVNPDPAGNQYAFARFTAPELLGEYEAMAGAPEYRSTLVALTDCTLITMTTEQFLAWMRQDHHALYLRACAITRQLVAQTSRERSHLFLSATDRLVLYLVSCYSQNAQAGECIVAATRQQMADETGYCLKTINRCVARLRDEGLVTIRGKRIVLDAGQYESLLAMAQEEASQSGTV